MSNSEDNTNQGSVEEIKEDYIPSKSYHQKAIPEKVVEKTPVHIWNICNKQMETVEIAKPWLCIIWTDWKDSNFKCSVCTKSAYSYQVSQEIQGLFDNLNHLLKMSEKSSQLMHDLEQSNRDMSKFARSLSGEPEEEKGEIDEGGMTEAKISEEPKFFKTNNKHSVKSSIVSEQPKEYKLPTMLLAKTEYLQKDLWKICGKTPTTPFYDFKDYKISIKSLNVSEYQQNLFEFYLQSEGISLKEVHARICKYLDKGNIDITIGEFRKKYKIVYSAITWNIKFNKYDSVWAIWADHVWQTLLYEYWVINKKAINFKYKPDWLNGPYCVNQKSNDHNQSYNHFL